MEKYSIYQQKISILLAAIEAGEIAIPRIQRPFVWSKTQVRNLIDSLYHGYPVGYTITWRNPNVQLKDGDTSQGKQILIDGQQRMTALRAAIVGEVVKNNRYKDERISISFNPITEEFKVKDKSTERGAEWIADISEVMRPDFKQLSFMGQYLAKNPEADKDAVYNNLMQLIQIKNREVGNIMLSSDLPIETVNEIFVRINSSGVSLSNADFAMSRIAVYEREADDEFGIGLCKFIDYFCDFSINAERVDDVEKHDSQFTNTDYFRHISWLRNDTNSIYDPDYSDILRVVSLTEFNRGKLSDFVALLAGRNFATRENLKEIADESFMKLERGVYKFTRKHNLERFVQDILQAAGFEHASMLGSKNVINYIYAMYLRAHDIGEELHVINKWLKRLLILSLLTGRHSGSFETQFEHDIKLIEAKGDIESFVSTLEMQTMTDVYWQSTLPGEFNKTGRSNPFWNIFTAAQNTLGYASFLSHANKTKGMRTAEAHHIFPKAYLLKHGIDRSMYDKVANFAYLHKNINIAVSDIEPALYMSKIREFSGEYGSDITSDEMLQRNLAENAIPQSLLSATHHDFEKFMTERRVLMAGIVKQYYESL